jgi:hypothetical protein
VIAGLSRGISCTATALFGRDGDRKMPKYFAAASIAVVIAALVIFAALVAMGSQCSSTGALPNLLGQSSPNASTGKTDKPITEKQGSDPRTRSKSPSASFELQMSDPDKMEGKLYLENWEGDRTAWVSRFVCNIGIGEFVIAVFTVILAVFAGLLWAGVHQLQDAVRAQKRDSEAIQRAYLSAHPLGVDPFNAAAYAEGRVGIRNVGRLPARKVRWFVDVTTSSDGRRVHFPIGQLSGNNVIQSGLEMSQAARIAISRQEFQNFQENGLWVYVWGAIHYDDGFGNERHTNFCHRYDTHGFSANVSGLSSQQTLQLGRAAISSESAVYHQHGNDAD